jgi:hypothetical protein
MNDDGFGHRRCRRRSEKKPIEKKDEEDEE